VHWLALELPAVDAPREVVLTLGQAGLQRAVLYWPLADGRWAGAEAGAARPVASWPLAHVQPAFAWRLGPGQTRAYLSVENPGPAALAWRLWERPAFEHQARLQHLAWGAVFGGLGLLLVLALGQACCGMTACRCILPGPVWPWPARRWPGAGWALYLWPARGGRNELWGPAWEWVALGLMLWFTARLARSALSPRGHPGLLGLGGWACCWPWPGCWGCVRACPCRPARCMPRWPG
jgi:hypothetical protein